MEGSGSPRSHIPPLPFTWSAGSVQKAFSCGKHSVYPHLLLIIIGNPQNTPSFPLFFSTARCSIINTTTLPGANLPGYRQPRCLHLLAWPFLCRVCFSLAQITCFYNHHSIWVLPNSAVLEAMRATLILLTNEFWHWIMNSDWCLCGSLVHNCKNHCTNAFYTAIMAIGFFSEHDYIFIRVNDSQFFLFLFFHNICFVLVKGWGIYPLLDCPICVVFSGHLPF